MIFLANQGLLVSKITELNTRKTQGRKSNGFIFSVFFVWSNLVMKAVFKAASIMPLKDDKWDTRLLLSLEHSHFHIHERWPTMSLNSLHICDWESPSTLPVCPPVTPSMYCHHRAVSVTVCPLWFCNHHTACPGMIHGPLPPLAHGDVTLFCL